ncbi:hypothetical protein WN56_12945 [Salinivibrio sp. KP-1]|nr:hypothetical protein WN56_12945 [Salinivibrio sp. KP-1]
MSISVMYEIDIKTIRIIEDIIRNLYLSLTLEKNRSKQTCIASTNIGNNTAPRLNKVLRDSNEQSRKASESNIFLTELISFNMYKNENVKRHPIGIATVRYV